MWAGISINLVRIDYFSLVKSLKVLNIMISPVVFKMNLFFRILSHFSGLFLNPINKQIE